MNWLHRLGPGLITACVVIGPGSILTSSKVGEKYGFAMNWVVLVSVACMLVYMGLGARLGMVAKQSPGELIAKRTSRPVAAVLGLSVFLISALFQFGNNLGVHAAADEFLLRPVATALVALLNALALAFLFAFKNLYRAVEKLMVAFVALMLLSFAANLLVAGPDAAEFAKGFVPGLAERRDPNAPAIDISLLGLVGTTFVVSAAFLQAYLVRQKGWSRKQVAQGMIDVRVGAAIMATITLMLIATAASVQWSEPPQSAGDIAIGLKPLFGGWGRPIFCVGLFSAAYSSFLVNSMIGGFILSDGLGLGSEPKQFWPRVFTAAVLVVGMTVAMVSIATGSRPVAAIVTAQALTVLAAPLLAGMLWWLTSVSSVMGEDHNRLSTQIGAGIGFLLLAGIAVYTAGWKVWPAIAPLLGIEGA